MSSLPLVEYLTQHYPDACGFDSFMISGAAASGDIDFVKLLASKGYKYEMASRACAYAARMGHLEMLKHLRSRQGLEWGWDCWKYAGAKNNNFAVLEYLLAEGCRPNKYAWDFAAQFGVMDALLFFKQHSFPGSSDAFPLAAKGGQMEALQLLHDWGWHRDQNGNEATWFGDNACDLAAWFGHLDALVWLVEKGLTVSSKTWELSAKRRNNYAMMEYLLANHLVSKDKRTINKIISNSRCTGSTTWTKWVKGMLVAPKASRCVIQ